MTTENQVFQVTYSVQHEETCQTVKVSFKSDWHTHSGNVADLVEQMVREQYPPQKIHQVVESPYAYEREYALHLASLHSRFELAPLMSDLFIDARYCEESKP